MSSNIPVKKALFIPKSHNVSIDLRTRSYVEKIKKFIFANGIKPFISISPTTEADTLETADSKQ